MMYNAGNALADRLRQFWIQDGFAILRPPVLEHEIDSFEKANNICFPDDFSSYLKCFNGFDQYRGHQDSKGFNFWPLENFASVSIYKKGKYNFHNADSYFIFSDYLDFSWAYAISLKEDNHEIVMIGTRDGQPRFVAENFSVFVDVYINNDNALYAS